MKYLQFATVLIALVFFGSSCVLDGDGVACRKASGEMETIRYELESFDKIELQMGADVVVSQGDGYSVEVEASENLHDIIVTNVSSDELVLRLERSKCIRGNHDIVFYVTCPDITGITLSGSGTITNATSIDADNIDMKVSGSGTIDLDNFNANDCFMSVSGSGDIILQGEEMNTMEAKISGSGTLQAFDAPANRVDVRISGSGDCEVTANESLDVHISGSGSVDYKGTPSITQKITGSGNIRNRN